MHTLQKSSAICSQPQHNRFQQFTPCCFQIDVAALLDKLRTARHKIDKYKAKCVQLAGQVQTLAGAISSRDAVLVQKEQALQQALGAARAQEQSGGRPSGAVGTSALCTSSRCLASKV